MTNTILRPCPILGSVHVYEIIYLSFFVAVSRRVSSKESNTFASMVRQYLSKCLRQSSYLTAQEVEQLTHYYILALPPDLLSHN